VPDSVRQLVDRHLAGLDGARPGLAEMLCVYRQGAAVGFTTADGLAAADLVDAVVEGAWRRWG
jgi:hypothetical protein